MGYCDENYKPVVIDLETVALDGVEKYLDPVRAPGNYKDAEKIAAYRANKREKDVALAALDVDLCRIVALGIALPPTYDPRVVIARSMTHEMAMIEAIWPLITNPAGVPVPIITFNGHSFDLPVLMRRSLYMGITHPRLSLDRYRSPHPDLMRVLDHNGLLDSRSLQFYCRRFGIDIPDEDPPCAQIAGEDIARLVEENTEASWSLIEGHCRRDIKQTVALARKLKAL